MKPQISLPEKISRLDLMNKIGELLCQEPFVPLKELSRFRHGNYEHTNGL